MKYVLTSLFVLLVHVGFSQIEVTATTITKHVGDSVKYCGKVASSRLMERASNTPALLNIDGAYPNQVFTVVIYKGDRINFPAAPEQHYLNKNVCVYGKLGTFKEQIQMVIRSEAQIVIQQ